jgi:hypothetical protein
MLTWLFAVVACGVPALAYLLVMPPVAAVITVFKALPTQCVKIAAIMPMVSVQVD